MIEKGAPEQLECTTLLVTTALFYFLACTVLLSIHFSSVQFAHSLTLLPRPPIVVANSSWQNRKKKKNNEDWLQNSSTIKQKKKGFEYKNDIDGNTKQ